MGECHLTVRGMAEVLLERAGIDSFMEMKLDEIGYFGQPASMGHHLAGYGGLMKHSINVTQRLVTLTDALGVKWPRSEWGKDDELREEWITAERLECLSKIFTPNNQQGFNQCELRLT